MTFVIKIPGACSDTSLAVLKRDQLLLNDNDGVRFLWDASFPFSYQGGVPSNGSVVNDVAEKGSGGSFVLSAGETIGFAGGGFNMAAMTSTSGATDAHVLGPSGVWSDIAADQRFLLCCYMRLPTEADWNTNAVLLPFFASSNGASNGYISVADPVTAAFKNTGKTISFRRQTAIGSMVETTLSPVGHYGAFAQVAYWRTASAVGASLRTAAGIVSASGAVGSANSADITACRPRFGSVKPFTNYSLAEHRTSRNHRIHRGFIENLARSSRDPVTVLSDDWARTVARGVFS